MNNNNKASILIPNDWIGDFFKVTCACIIKAVNLLRTLVHKTSVTYLHRSIHLLTCLWLLRMGE